MPRSTLETVDAKINAIRTKALGHEHAQCPTCCKPAAAPFRQQDGNGKIIAGCIDAFHGPALCGGGSTSNSAQWHMRPSAVTMRRQTLAQLRIL